MFFLSLKLPLPPPPKDTGIGLHLDLLLNGPGVFLLLSGFASNPGGTIVSSLLVVVSSGSLLLWPHPVVGLGSVGPDFD